ncbi:hypothetical protein [Mesorhizobium sp. M0323]|uniref:hypothetical protein n=1 Tax=Mesorhizobium sp. M0323 TaxID=2956938 RepID=UPI003337D01C
MPARPTVATAFQRLISSEDHRQMLRNRLGLEVDGQLPASLAALLQELERREQVEADWSASTWQTRAALWRLTSRKEPSVTVMAMLRKERGFRMISSEDYRRKLRGLLRFVGEPTLTPTLAALAQELSEELEQRKQQSADENP